MSSVITTLVDLGRTHTNLSKGTRPLKIDGNTQGALSHLRRNAPEKIKTEWTNASAHLDGAGPEHGVDMCGFAQTTRLECKERSADSCATKDIDKEMLPEETLSATKVPLTSGNSPLIEHRRTPDTDASSSCQGKTKRRSRSCNASG